MTALSARTLAGELKHLYDNTPLPAGQAAGIALDFLLDRRKPAPLPVARPLLRVAGAGLALAGAGLILGALVERRRRSSGPFELERPQEVATTGPYSISRHPMYVGWWFIHFGLGVARGSSWVFLTFPAAVIVEHFGVVHEENLLVEHFGQSYRDYAARVPRYLSLRAAA